MKAIRLDEVMKDIVLRLSLTPDCATKLGFRLCNVAQLTRDNHPNGTVYLVLNEGMLEVEHGENDLPCAVEE